MERMRTLLATAMLAAACQPIAVGTLLQAAATETDYDSDHDGTPDNTTDPPTRWPNNTVHYYIDANMDWDHRQLLMNAFEDYEQLTAIDFVQMNNAWPPSDVGFVHY